MDDDSWTFRLVHKLAIAMESSMEWLLDDDQPPRPAARAGGARGAQTARAGCTAASVRAQSVPAPTPAPAPAPAPAPTPAPARARGAGAPPRAHAPTSPAGGAACEGSEVVLLARWRAHWRTQPLPPDGRVRRTPELTALVRAGVPATDRVAFWCACTGADALLREPANRGEYARLVALAGAGGAPRSACVQIEKDLNRTFAGMSSVRIPEEEGMAALRRLLSAFAAAEPQIGYTQSMNFVAAMLLLLMDEERAFWVLRAMINGRALRGYYADSMDAAVADQLVFKDALASALPSVSAHLHALGVAVPLVSTAWFLCLFVCCLPLPVLLPVWDLLLFYDGSEPAHGSEAAHARATQPAPLAPHADAPRDARASARASARARTAPAAADPTGGARVLLHVGIELVRLNADALLRCESLEAAYTVLSRAGTSVDPAQLLHATCDALDGRPVDGPPPLGLGRPLAQLRDEAAANLPAALARAAPPRVRAPAPPSPPPTAHAPLASAAQPRHTSPPLPPRGRSRSPPAPSAAADGAVDSGACQGDGGACDGACGEFECLAAARPSACARGSTCAECTRPAGTRRADTMAAHCADGAPSGRLGGALGRWRLRSAAPPAAAGADVQCRPCAPTGLAPTGLADARAGGAAAAAGGGAAAALGAGGLGWPTSGLSYVILQLSHPELIEGYFQQAGRKPPGPGEPRDDAARGAPGGAPGRMGGAAVARPPARAPAFHCGAALASVRMRLDSLSGAVIEDYHHAASFVDGVQALG
ncbi:hypothetical protein KFE25_013876 [Diacronema lutheri]|uniref:Rab-GAP TBC domain-containing protein n=1 Tax=Diacronema lutheri TaxID=2081491 RepID=A0A8J6C4M7_DIALT|nr:hypothetical protein KFE25_013876 [Diacronema lutheri]